MTHCPRCGKTNAAEIHSCTPKALVLADELERHIGEFETATRAAAELRRLHSDNEQLAEFVIAVGGFWGHSRSKLVGEDSLAECINRGGNDEALLKQALECLERSDTLGWQANLPAITAIKERLG
jgi:hypothetical protein